jgi:hypothetical protein
VKILQLAPNLSGRTKCIEIWCDELTKAKLKRKTLIDLSSEQVTKDSESFEN